MVAIVDLFAVETQSSIPKLHIFSVPRAALSLSLHESGGWPTLTTHEPTGIPRFSMVKQSEPRTTASDHVVQLFDTPESVGETVASFLAEGATAGEPLLVVARAIHTQCITTALAAHDIAVSTLLQSGRLTMLDAVAILRQLLVSGMPDEERFERVIGDLVRGLAADGVRVRIYGEIVDVLAEQLEFGAAVRLEQLWNTLARTTPMLLLCGYSSAHFAPSSAAGRLHDVCSCHERVMARQSDMLGSWILSQQLLAPEMAEPAL